MRTFMKLTIPAGLLLWAAAFQPGPGPAEAARPTAQGPSVQDAPAALDTAVFAGGCFWCMEPPYDKLDGVVSTTSGYAGGEVRNPSYDAVSDGGTGHAEVVRVVYDPAKVGYEKLLYIFWRNVDPLTPDAQFCDHGSQYRTAIFYKDEAQKAAAEASKRALEESGRFKRPIVTEIEPLRAFYPAEEYHQDYYEKNPIRYKAYRFSCGRDARLRQVWGDDAGGGVG